MIWTLVLALIFMAAPAAAEFTADEKANVHNLILGVNLIRSGLRDQIAAESWGGYATAWQATVDCHDALGYLFGTQIKQGAQARSQLAATPRSGWLALAWKSLDRCITELDSAQAQAWAATNKYVQARIIIAAFPRGATAPMNGPIASAKAAPAAYQNPKPASYPKVIGPHGDYDFAQEHLWFAVKYVHDSLYIFGSRYLCDAADYESIIVGALANVRFTGNETADGFDSTVVDAVDNVLWLQKFALQDTAVKYLAATMNEYAESTEPILKAALPALVKHNDSWKNLDRAIRNTVCFDGRISCDRTPH
jgi:hypothetical protein